MTKINLSSGPFRRALFNAVCVGVTLLLSRPSSAEQAKAKKAPTGSRKPVAAPAGTKRNPSGPRMPSPGPGGGPFRGGPGMPGMRPPMPGGNPGGPNTGEGSHEATTGYEPSGDDVVDLLWRKTDFYFHRGDYENAIRLHRLIVEYEPDFTDAYGVCAWLIESQGRDKEALAFLKQGLKANPEVYDLYFEIGNYYFKRKDPKKAREYWEQAVKYEHPFYVTRMLAHACEKMGDLEASRKVWKQILSQDPNDGVAILNLKRVESKLSGGK